jgi:hypothetical protein
MSELRGYHNDAALKKSVIAQMAAYRGAEKLIKGTYGNEGGVSCLVGNNHALYKKTFGIPEMLGRLEDCIFDGLPEEKAQKWPERFLSAIKVGVNLSLVGWKFQLWSQIENHKRAKRQKMPDDVIAAIKGVIPFLKILAEGKTLTKKQILAASVAASTAWSAASARSARLPRSSLAASAAYSARSARLSRSPRSAWSASASAMRSVEAARSALAAWEKMADKLIELIEAA